MSNDFVIAVFRSPGCPNILHNNPRGENERIRHVRRKVDRAVDLIEVSASRRGMRFVDAYLDAALCLCFEVHIDSHVGQEHAGDAVPRPALNPPGCYDEEEGTFDAPASTSIRYNNHCPANHGIRIQQCFVYSVCTSVTYM